MDFKLKVNSKTNREMWFKGGKLVAANSVPDNVKSRLRAPEQAKDRPKVEKDPSLSTVKLSGFIDEVENNNETRQEKESQEKKALEVLNEKFPEFTFEVNYSPSRKYGNIMLKPTYKIDVFADGNWQCVIRATEFNIPSIKNRLNILLEGPPTPTTAGDRFQHVKTESTHLGSKDIQK